MMDEREGAKAEDQKNKTKKESKEAFDRAGGGAAGGQTRLLLLLLFDPLRTDNAVVIGVRWVRAWVRACAWVRVYCAVVVEPVFSFLARHKSSNTATKVSG